MKNKILFILAVMLISSSSLSAAKRSRTPKKSKKTRIQAMELKDSGGIKMIKVQPGTFTMGSPENELGRNPDETQHKVMISKPFYMSETEITQSQYIPLMIPDYDPLFISAGGYGHSLPEVHSGGPFWTYSKYNGKRENCPMEGVTWEKAVEFCEKLTEKYRASGDIAKSMVFRLPTEAEWEYVCRAGTESAFNMAQQQNRVLKGTGVSLRPMEVKKSLAPNAWGFYDMHGNVYEWCLDDYGPYEKRNQRNPLGVFPGAKKIARGGAYLSGCKIDNSKEWSDDPKTRARFLRSASRNKFLPDFPLGIMGLRIVLAEEIKID